MINESTDRPLAQEKLNPPPPMIVVETYDEKPSINWLKLWGLVILTYALIVAWVWMSIGIETMKTDSTGKRSVVQSWEDGGGLILAFFVFYVGCFGTAWFFGSRKREQIRRDVVEKQIQRQRAAEKLMYVEDE